MQVKLAHGALNTQSSLLLLINVVIISKDSIRRFLQEGTYTKCSHTKEADAIFQVKIWVSERL